MRAFWHGICLSGLSTYSAMQLCHSPVLLQSSVRTLSSTKKKYIILPCSVCRLSR